MKKKTTEEFIRDAIKIHGDKYDYSKVKYVNSLQPVLIFCNKCKTEFYQKPKCHLKGCGCLNCNFSKAISKKTKSTEEFIQEAKKKYGNQFNYNDVQYINNRTKVKITCNKCHNTFYQTPTNHLRFGCSKCGIINRQIKRRTGKEKFIKQANKNGGNFDYSKVIYINTDKKVEIICKDCHNVFWQTPHQHLKCHGCPYCKKISLNNDILNRFIEIHNDKYDYSKLKYIGYDNKSEIICKKCGKSFWQTPGDHLKGHGCPYCAKSRGENAIKFLLDKNNINYIHQKKFNDCRDKNPLPFDFYLPELNVCIEYQGRQHYKEGIRFFIAKRKSKELGIEAYKKQKLHDKIKKQYCKKHNIKLLEIKYCDNIEKKLNSIIKGVK